MQEPGPIDEKLEEQQEQLNVESKRISELREEVNQLKQIVRLLHSSVGLQASLLANAPKTYFMSSNEWKAAIAKIDGLYVELGKQLGKLR